MQVLECVRMFITPFKAKTTEPIWLKFCIKLRNTLHTLLSFLLGKNV